MNIKITKVWKSIGISGLIIAALWGNLIYMNLRLSDPILPGWEEYSQPRFEELLERGEPLLVEVYASWCPTCLLQHKAFETLIEESQAPNIRAIRVDYERDPDFLQKYNIRGTGILIIFADGKEISRASGLVTADKILGFLSPHAL
tara:strand:+ start:285 stop:722 length:438 start_codon:yes stop_codon:yes gene_type:complete